MTIDITIVDKIDKKIKSEITDIGNAADTAYAKIEKLKKVLKLRSDFGTNSTKSYVEQETALNKLIASEQQLTTSMQLNEEKIKRAKQQTATEMQQANNAVSQSNFRLQAQFSKTTAAAKVAANEVSASYSKLLATQQQANNAISASNAKLQQTYSKIASNAQKAANSVASSTAKMQAAITQANNAITLSNERTKDSIERLAIARTKTTKLNDLQIASAPVRANNQIALSNARLQAGLDRLSSSTLRYAAANSSLIRSLNSVKISMSGINTSLRNIETGFVTATSRLRGFLATIVLLGSANRGIEILDTFQTMQNQLRLSSDTPKQLDELTKGVFNMAQTTRVPLDGLAKTWRRVDDAVKQYGVGQAGTFQITTAMTGLLTLSGASATEAAASMLQLSQAFSKGKLDGDEFRTTAELMPAVLREIAKVMQVPLGSLFDLSQQGKITVKVLIDAFRNLYEKVLSDLERIPKTIGSSLVLLANEVKFAFSKNATESGWVLAITGGLEKLRANFDVVAKSAIAFSTVVAAMTGIGLLSWFLSLINPISSLSLVLVGVIGYFSYFSSELTIAGEKSATLGDAVKALFQELSKLVSGESFDKLFSAETAQKGLNALLPAIRQVLTGMNAITASTTTLGNVLSTTFANHQGLLQFALNMEKLYILMQFRLLVSLRDFAKELLNLKSFSLDDIGASIFEKLKGSAQTALSLARGLMVHLKGSGLERDFGEVIENAQKKIDGLNAEVGGKVIAEHLAIAISPLTKIDEQLRLLGESDYLKNSALFKDMPKAGEKVKHTLDSIQQDWTNTFSGLENTTSKFLENVATTAEVIKNKRLAKQFLDEAAGKNLKQIDNSALRPDEIGLTNEASQAAEKIKQSASYGQQLASYFGDAHKYAAGIQDMMRSVNKSMVDDLAKYQSQLLGNEIKSTIANNPDYYKRPGSNFNPKFIDSLSGGGDSASIQQQTQAISTAMQTAVQAANAALQGLDGSPIANLGAIAQQASQAVTTSITTAAQQSNSSMQNISTTGFETLKSQATTTGQAVGTGIQSGVQEANSALTTIDASGMSSISSTAQQVGQTIGQSISQGAQQARAAIEQMAGQSVGALNNVAQAAQRAATAIQNLNSLGGVGGGISLPGLSSGGWTGNGPKSAVAGVVHGQEFVVPAGPAKAYRPLLEAMRSGRSLPPTGASPERSIGGSAVNVTVENYGSSKIEVQQLSANEIRIIAREESVKSVANAIRNPNSRVSKSLNQNTTVSRRR